MVAVELDLPVLPRCRPSLAAFLLIAGEALWEMNSGDADENCGAIVESRRPSGNARLKAKSQSVRRQDHNRSAHPNTNCSLQPLREEELAETTLTLLYL